MALKNVLIFRHWVIPLLFYRALKSGLNLKVITALGGSVTTYLLSKLSTCLSTLLNHFSDKCSSVGFHLTIAVVTVTSLNEGMNLFKRRWGGKWHGRAKPALREMKFHVGIDRNRTGHQRGQLADKGVKGGVRRNGSKSLGGWGLDRGLNITNSMWVIVLGMWMFPRLAGYKGGACRQSSSVIFALKILIGIVPTILILLGLFILLFYPITEKSRKETKQALEQLR